MKSLLNKLIFNNIHRHWNLAISDIDDELNPYNIKWMKHEYNDRWFVLGQIADETLEVESYPIDRIVRRKERMIVKDINKYNFEIQDDKMNILLSHLPNILFDKYIMKKCPQIYQYDLVLSGHFHGGFTEEQEACLNKTIDRLEEIKLLKKHKEYLESLRYAGYIEISLNPIPCLAKTTRGMHEVGGTTMIISRGAKTKHGLDDAYVTEVKLQKTKNP